MENNKLSENQKPLEFLRKNPHVVLASINKENLPETASLFIHITDDFKIYFMTKDDTRKYSNIKNNPYVAIESYNMKDLTAVQFEGIAKEIEDQTKFIEILNALSEKVEESIQDWAPVAKIGKGKPVIFEITPLWVRYRDFKTDTIASKTIDSTLQETTIKDFS